MSKIKKIISVVFAVFSLAVLYAMSASAVGQVTNYSLTKVNKTVVDLKWSAVSGAAGYNVYDNGTKIIAGVQGTSIRVNDLTPGTEHKLKVRAYEIQNGAVVEGASGGEKSFKQTFSGKPSGMSIYKTDDPTVVEVVFYGTGVSGNDGYSIYDNGVKVAYTTKAHPVGSAMKVHGLAPNEKHSLTARAVIIDAVSGKEFRSSSTDSHDITQEYGKVEGFSVSQNSPVAVNLKWSGKSKANGYNVYVDGVFYKSTTSTSMTIGSLVPGQSHEYKVRAYITDHNNFGTYLNFEGKSSDHINFTTSIARVTSIKTDGYTRSSIPLSWTLDGQADGVKVYMDGNLVKTITGTTETSYLATGLGYGTSHTFRVVPYSGSYDGQAASITTVTKVTNTKRIDVVEIKTNSIEISWEPVDRASKYSVYNNGTKVLETTSTSAIITGLKNDTSYEIKVSAYNAVGDKSSQVTVITARTCAVDISLKEISVTSYSATTQKSTYRIVWYSIPRTGDEVYRYKITDNYQGEKILDYNLYTVDTTPKAFDINVNEDAAGFTTISWPAIAGSKYYEVQVSPLNIGKNTWSTVATTTGTSAVVVLAPNCDLAVRVMAYDREVTITGYRTQKTASGDYELTTPYTGTRVIRLPGKVSSYVNIKTKAVDITKTDNMSKTKAILTVIQAINNSKNEKTAVTIEGRRDTVGKVNKSKVEFERKKLIGGWESGSMDLDPFLKLFGDKDMFKEITEELNETQNFSIKFDNGRGSGTIIEDGVKIETSGMDINALITPENRTAYLYDAANINAIDSKISNINITENADGTKKITFKILKETAYKSNPECPVHAGIYDSMAKSLELMEESGPKSRIENGSTTVSAIINIDGTLDSLDISSKYVFIMSMGMEDDGEGVLGNDDSRYRNITINLDMSGTSVASYQFLRTGLKCTFCRSENVSYVPEEINDCSKPSYNAGVYCNNCNRYFRGHEQLIGKHVGEVKLTIVPESCIAEGKELYICSTCGEVLYEAVIPVNDIHTYAPTVVAPTCVSKGYTTYTCTLCGNSYVDEESYTDMTNHISDDGVITRYPTSSTPGIKTYSCVVCGTVLRTEEISGILIGDVTGDGLVNTADRMVLSRYLANWDGYESRIQDMAALDVNGDGNVNTADRMILSRYLANWDGYSHYFD